MEEGYGLGGNRHFTDLRDVDSQNVRDAINFENLFLEMLASGSDYDDAVDVLDENLGNFFGLDPGVTSAAITLSALGAIPFSSCNGGTLGGSHHERYPLIALYSPSRHVLNVIERICTQVGLGLVAEEGRTEIIVYSDSLLPFRKLSELFLQQTSNSAPR
jgi:hypothetical protein